MSSQKDKIVIPEDIKGELSLFVSINKDYKKTKIPLNLIDPDLALSEILCLYDFVIFKLNCSNELGFNEEEVLELENFKDANEPLLKVDSFLKTYQESREGNKEVNKFLSTMSFKVVLGFFLNSLLEYQEETAVTLEYISGMRKKLNNQITGEKLSKAEEIGLLEKLNNENKNLTWKLFECYWDPYRLNIYSYMSAIIRQSNKYTETAIQIIRNLVMFLDQQLYYTYVLLNCQKLFLQYEKSLYVFLLNPNSKDSAASMDRKQFSSTIKLYQISKVYEEVYPKYKDTIAITLKEVNKLIDCIGEGRY